MPSLIFGGMGGLGLATIARAIRGRRPRLGRVLHSLDSRRGSSWHGTLAPLASRVSGQPSQRVRDDLATLDRTPAAHASEKLACALGCSAAAIAFVTAVAMADVGMPPLISVVLVVCAASIGYVVPDVSLRSAAQRRRATLRHALSSYLDLVNVLLAGGAGVETALEAAAGAGDGWAFDQIRETVVRARSTRRSPWECFADLGRRMNVGELMEVAASVQLAGEHGARIKLSLSAKAASLRAHQAARIEAEANAATERMGLPTVLMFLGFMVLLGYPAAHQIVGSL